MRNWKDCNAWYQVVSRGAMRFKTRREAQEHLNTMYPGVARDSMRVVEVRPTVKHAMTLPVDEETPVSLAELRELWRGPGKSGVDAQEEKWSQGWLHAGVVSERFTEEVVEVCQRYVDKDGLDRATLVSLLRTLASGVEL